MAEYLAKSLKQDKEDWMTKKWRPMMAITYMAINIFDFILGPILYNLLQFWNPGQAVGMWQPLTLQGGGLIHISFGAILGVAAWTRGQEKVASINNGIDPNAAPQYVTQTTTATYTKPNAADEPVPSRAALDD